MRSCLKELNQGINCKHFYVRRIHDWTCYDLKRRAIYTHNTVVNAFPRKEIVRSHASSLDENVAGMDKKISRARSTNQISSSGPRGVYTYRRTGDLGAGLAHDCSITDSSTAKIE